MKRIIAGIVMYGAFVASALAAPTAQLSGGKTTVVLDPGATCHQCGGTLRHLADDLRVFYHEAVAAQPGPGAPNHDALNEWIFSGTALGEALQALGGHLTQEGSPMSLLVRGLLIPEGHFRGGTTFAT